MTTSDPDRSVQFPDLGEGVIGGVAQLVYDARELHAALRTRMRFND